ncbi:hypothetical protein CEXT_750651 [Caerostris extrusa]|uniref:MBD domain-containing protein n=1 Tax=Caerostris extrusa TaxID=172846 RepID=A0AAV4PLE5_CAEEX|nr:hypothetical protein CEXT_750651 [Caerostris extrusa]
MEGKMSNLKTKFPALLEISLGLNDQVKLKSALSENILEHFADCIFLKLIRLITCEHQFNMMSLNKRKLETQNQDTKFKKSKAGTSVRADQTDDGLSAGDKSSNDSKDQGGEVLVLSNGWKRQCVIRKSGKTAGMLDVYFYSPDGMKFRSKPEVVKYIKMKKLNLNIQEFDFSKKKIKDHSKDVNKKDKGKKKKSMLSKNKYDFKRKLFKKKPSIRRDKGNEDECEVRSEDKEKAMFEKKPEEYSSNKSKVVKIDSKKTTEDIEVEEESLGNNKEKAMFEKKPKEYSSNKSKVVKIDSKKTTEDIEIEEESLGDNKEKAMFEKKPKEYSSNKSKVVKIDSKKTTEDIEVEEESLGNNPNDDSKENGSEKTYPNRKGQDRHECEIKSAKHEKEGLEEMAEDASNDTESGTGNTKNKGIQFHVDCKDKYTQVDLEEFREVNEDVKNKDEKNKDERNESKSSPQIIPSVVEPVEEEENDENIPEEKFQLMALIKRRYM